MNSFDPRTNRRIAAHYNNEIMLWVGIQNQKISSARSLF